MINSCEKGGDCAGEGVFSRTDPSLPRAEASEHESRMLERATSGQVVPGCNPQHNQDIEAVACVPEKTEASAVCEGPKAHPPEDLVLDHSTIDEEVSVDQSQHPALDAVPELDIGHPLKHDEEAEEGTAPSQQIPSLEADAMHPSDEGASPIDRMVVSTGDKDPNLDLASAGISHEYQRPHESPCLEGSSSLHQHHERPQRLHKSPEFSAVTRAPGRIVHSSEKAIRPPVSDKASEAVSFALNQTDVCDGRRLPPSPVALSMGNMILSTSTNDSNHAVEPSQVHQRAPRDFMEALSSQGTGECVDVEDNGVDAMIISTASSGANRSLVVSADQPRQCGETNGLDSNDDHDYDSQVEDEESSRFEDLMFGIQTQAMFATQQPLSPSVLFSQDIDNDLLATQPPPPMPSFSVDHMPQTQAEMISESESSDHVPATPARSEPQPPASSTYLSSAHLGDRGEEDSKFCHLVNACTDNPDDQRSLHELFQRCPFVVHWAPAAFPIIHRLDHPLVLTRLHWESSQNSDKENDMCLPNASDGSQRSLQKSISESNITASAIQCRRLVAEEIDQVCPRLFVEWIVANSLHLPTDIRSLPLRLLRRQTEQIFVALPLARDLGVLLCMNNIAWSILGNIVSQRLYISPIIHAFQHILHLCSFFKAVESQ